MNRTKNTIGWCDFSWNPITGCPEPHCWYCFAKKMYRRFPALGNPDFVPKFFPERLKELGQLKKPSKIFVCSCADLFAEEVLPEWRNAVFAEMEKTPQHIYQLLTKRPQNINRAFPANVWVGVTVTNEKDSEKIDIIKNVCCGVHFVSFEPLLGKVAPYLAGIDWIIIGKLTGSKKIPLDRKAVQLLIDLAKQRQIPVFVKNNIGWKEKLQEFPILKREAKNNEKNK